MHKQWHTSIPFEKSSMQFLLFFSRDTGKPPILISFPSAKDPSWKTKHAGFNSVCPKLNHVGKSTCIILTEGKYEWFQEWSKKPQGKRGDDYERLKKQFMGMVPTISAISYFLFKISWKSICISISLKQKARLCSEKLVLHSPMNFTLVLSEVRFSFWRN